MPTEKDSTTLGKYIPIRSFKGDFFDYLSLDERTQRLLTKEKERLNLLESEPVWFFEPYIVEKRLVLFWNEDVISYAELSLDKKEGHYLYYVIVEAGGDTRHVVCHRFSQEVLIEFLLAANIVYEAAHYFMSPEEPSPYIDCLLCNSSFHWSETEGDFEEKWYQYVSQTCPCEYSKENTF